MATDPIAFPCEERSNGVRRQIAACEPPGLRTYTPSLAVLARSAGAFHWTPEGRRLYDYTSGVLVANLGHNPRGWLERFWQYMGWRVGESAAPEPYLSAVPLTAYNAATELEATASRRLVELMQSCPGGGRMQQVLWAASGSEAIQKALWCALHRDPTRDMILATRDGFHGKKGLAGAVTGNEQSPERDPRVRFISFPRHECADVSLRGRPADLTQYQHELEAVQRQYGRRLTALITEPYLGAAGSFHPPPQYLQLLERFCREHDLVFILDEVQSNFGRTGSLFAFETYGVEPDMVVLGKGLANGVPVAAAVGPPELLGTLQYGEGSDTFSGNPLTCAAVLATLDCFQAEPIMEHARKLSAVMEAGLVRLKEIPFVPRVRGEGLVWGIEIGPHGGRSPGQMAIECVRTCYLGEPDGDGIHLLGPLADCVLRISPPLTMTEQEAADSLALLYRLFQRLAQG